MMTMIMMVTRLYMHLYTSFSRKQTLSALENNCGMGRRHNYYISIRQVALLA